MSIRYLVLDQAIHSSIISRVLQLQTESNPLTNQYQNKWLSDPIEIFAPGNILTMMLHQVLREAGCDRQ